MNKKKNIYEYLRIVNQNVKNLCHLAVGKKYFFAIAKSIYV